MDKLNELDLKDLALQNEAKTIYAMLKRMDTLKDGTYDAKSVDGEDMKYTILDKTIKLTYASGETVEFTDDGSEDFTKLDPVLQSVIHPAADRMSPIQEFTL